LAVSDHRAAITHGLFVRLFPTNCYRLIKGK